MNIRVGKYRLSANSKDFTVSQVGVKKEGEKAGEEYDSDQSYHPSLPMALENLLKRKVLDSDATTLKELLAAHKRVRLELLALFFGVGK